MKRALVLIDLQNEYVDGGLPISYPALDVSVPNIVRALDAADAAGIATVGVQHVDDASSPVFARGSRGADLPPALDGRVFAHRVEKQEASALDGTDLADWIAREGVDTLTLIGYMTQNCIEATARDAAQRGLSVEVLSDATGTLDLANEAGSISAKDLHESVLIVLHTGFAAVGTTEAWVGAVAAGKPLAAGDLYSSTEVARNRA
ncbi:N-carbamoylsarcosine amidase [Frondihabitans sp. 762G35]|uniref:cysteine hydrolase family protein n=1 Tax=Frondihabitans sp. 762G35 TaxID=1446794 RepID=UPI000D22973E|nr:cysteine hydrolase family protein [Frondihabitans sp. 762G35]ARC58516.1 N-carbamoylsarcosine amidase [Frondihabitans sp. 762G35]